MNSEASFLFSTFNEFYKCWRSGANSRLFIESVNGKAFINFSAFLGNPDDAHFKPWHSKRNPSKVQRKKSAKKIKRDNDRAARFQESKRKEEVAASAPKSADKPEAIVTSSPGAESAMTISGLEFSFSSPVPENLRHDASQGTSMILSDKKEPEKQDGLSLTSMTANDSIEHKKQDDTLNSSSGLDFQGEEEEVEEHQTSSTTERSEIERSDPAIENIRKLGRKLFHILDKQSLVDEELYITILRCRHLIVVNTDLIAGDLRVRITAHGASLTKITKLGKKGARKMMSAFKDGDQIVAILKREDSSTDAFSMTISRSEVEQYQKVMN